MKQKAGGSPLRTALALAVIAGCSSSTIIVGPDGGPVSGSSSGSGGGGIEGGSSSSGVAGSGSGSGAGSGSGSGGTSSGAMSSSSGSSSGGVSGSSSSGAGGSSGGGGSDSGGSSGSGGGTGSSGGPGDGGGPDAGCGTFPALHQGPPGDVSCSLGADGGVLDCLAASGTGTCCVGGSIGGGGFEPEICAANAAGCTNGAADAGGTAAIPIQCWQVADCAPNGVSGAQSCCIQGGATQPAPNPGCLYVRSKAGTAVACETTPTCAPGEVQICASQADCPANKMCMPGKWKIFDVGFCL